MIPDEKTIKSRSMSVYKTLSNALRCTFDELQNQCKLGTTELCLSIARLMQEIRLGKSAKEIMCITCWLIE